MLVLVAALALSLSGVAAAADPGVGSRVLCGIGCAGGGGYTGCKTIEASHSSSVWLVYSVRHAFRVSYCKVNGVITSISSQVNYCDVSGLASCSPTVWFQTGGGLGATWATFEAHATWTIAPAHIYNSTDILGLTIPTIDG
jgi:hypothetical protein